MAEEKMVETAGCGKGVAVLSIGEFADELQDVIALRCVPSFEKSVALMKLDECVLWATEALAAYGVWSGEE